MRHVALFVRDLEACISFYTSLMGMEVEWRPDEQNAYLTSGSDNLALHQALTDHERDESAQRLDHIGFFQKNAEDVDHWFEFLQDHGVKMRTEPRIHRDGARSFYCYDPDGTVIQIIHHPPVADWEQIRGIN
ncbi:MAG TPA: glyoxalase [Gammaproteobacteria bacterium]|nr:glyoxalase [Gammaproteobacteria bacterium]